MSNELDKYLQGVAHELRGLEAEQREAEMREMRGHLEAIVARLVAGGASRAEATAAALAQFGQPHQVGRELSLSSQGREPLWRTVLAPVCGTACSLALIALFRPALAYHFFNPSNPSLWFVVMPIVGWLIAFSSGIVAGFLSPRWGGRLLLGAKLLQVVALTVFSPAPPEMRWQQLLLMLVSNGTSIPLGASLGSRLARRRERTAGPTEVA